MKNKLTIVFLALAAAVSLNAQSFQEGFLLNNYRLAFRYNPALHSEGDFLSLGEFTSVSHNNVGAAAFYYPHGEKVYTGFHSSISSAEFLGAFPAVSAKQSHLEYSLFAYGFSRGKSHHTLEVGARGMYGVAVPQDIFRFLKEGGEDTFSFVDTRVQGKLYLQLAYGYSRQIGDKLSLGIRGKLLAGLYGADLRFDRFDLRMSGERIVVDVESQLDLTSSTGKIQEGKDGYLNPLSWSAKDKWRLPSGGGLAVDLGLAWEPVEGLRIAASVLDLGGLFWYYGNAARSKGTSSLTGVQNLTMDDLNLNGALNQVRAIGGELQQPLKYTAVDRRIAFDALPFQANAGIRYSFPKYPALSFGLTGNYTAYQGLPYWEGRLGAALNPFNWLDLTANLGYGSYGMVWGAAAQFRVYRFRVHAGLQNGFGGTIPYKGTPLQANAKTLVVGLTYDL